MVSVWGLLYLLAVAAVSARSSNRMFPVRVFVTVCWADFRRASAGIWAWIDKIRRSGDDLGRVLQRLLAQRGHGFHSGRARELDAPRSTAYPPPQSVAFSGLAASIPVRPAACSGAWP